MSKIMYTIDNADGAAFNITTKADLYEVPAPLLLATYNDLAGKNTKKFASRDKGVDQVWALISEVAATPEPAPKSRETGRKDRLNEAATIKIDDEQVAAAGARYGSTQNPKRPNTQAHVHWEKYHNGMTLLELQKKQGVPLSDIRWNLDKGFITLVDPA